MNMQVLSLEGNFDITCPPPGVVEMYRQMTSWSGREEFFKTQSAPYDVDGETVGYLKRVRNLRRVILRNAGHGPAAYRRRASLDVFEKFISNNL